MSGFGALAGARVLVTGGTGFVGRPLVEHLARGGSQLMVLSRSEQRVRAAFAGLDNVEAATTVDACANFAPEYIINLAGEGIADKRWTTSRKKELEASRVGLTQDLAAAIDAACKRSTDSIAPPKRVLTASAIGYYGPSSSAVRTEDSSCGEGYAAELCQKWEEAATTGFGALGSEVTVMRLGVVVGQGGILNRLRLPFSLGLGGVIGTGEQGMSWVHIDDVHGIISTLLTSPAKANPAVVNVVAPNPATNSEWTSALAASLHRPAFLPMPSFAVRLLFGEMGEELLLSGPLVQPEAAEHALQYQFKFPRLQDALAHVLSAWK